MLFMVIERFKNRDAKAVYRRFREMGRMAPKELSYVESWVETNFDRCFQLMECEDPSSWNSGRLDGKISWTSSLSRCAARTKRLRSSLPNCNSGPTGVPALQ
jgi:hypothetical protein